ncbi:AbrB/MazE/SpoVT family DNA-binding domain-containing protein [Geoglobus acetivorans]|uniref:Phosphate uptake regulator PhoU n=1 Tax=Geoglobus acetivorans TaxID=565033 RepID=A0ABZ3H5X5_GEOAI|nr:phosphate uptake regulator PhoU [Geoglobus acetivorans]
MEVRKLQLIGGSSFMVSLPKNWIKKNNLDQGDDIILDIDEDVIKIMPKKYSEESKVVKAIIEKLPAYDERFLRRFIIALYIQGLDEIEIRDKMLSPKLVSRISGIVHEIIGFEVIDAQENTIVLRSLTTAEFDIIGVLKRMSQIVLGIIDSIIDSINIDDRDGLKEIQKLEEDSDRLYMLAVRLENRVIRDLMSPSKWSETRNILGMRIVAKTLEEISDSLYDFSDALYSLDNFSEDSKQYLEILSRIEDVFRKVMDSYMKSSTEAANDAIDIADGIENDLLASIKEGRENPTIMYPLIDISRRIKSIGEIAINKSVRELIITK